MYSLKKKKVVTQPNNKFADCLFQLLSFWEGWGSKHQAKMQKCSQMQKYCLSMLFYRLIKPLLVLWQNNSNDRHN